MYVADLLVGVVVNVALVGMLAPFVRFGQPSASSGFLGPMLNAYNALPSRYNNIPFHSRKYLTISRLVTRLLKFVCVSTDAACLKLRDQGVDSLLNRDLLRTSTRV